VVLAFSDDNVARALTVIVPDPMPTFAVLDPYALDVPYWNSYVVDEWFGLTAPVTFAEDDPTPDALPVVTLGACALYLAIAVAGAIENAATKQADHRASEWSRFGTGGVIRHRSRPSPARLTRSQRVIGRPLYLIIVDIVCLSLPAQGAALTPRPGAAYVTPPRNARRDTRLAGETPQSSRIAARPAMTPDRIAVMAPSGERVDLSRSGEPAAAVSGSTRQTSIARPQGL
jgi:hypothetical protein